MKFSVIYEVLDDYDKVETVSEINQNDNNNDNVVGNFKSDDEAKENIFCENVNDEVDLTPKTMISPKGVLALRKL